jgi:hypothetical protein
MWAPQDRLTHDDIQVFFNRMTLIEGVVVMITN